MQVICNDFTLFRCCANCARNMQNFSLLKAVGHINKPVLLKRGLSATIEEFVNV